MAQEPEQWLTQEQKFQVQYNKNPKVLLFSWLEQSGSWIPKQPWSHKARNYTGGGKLNVMKKLE